MYSSLCLHGSTSSNNENVVLLVWVGVQVLGLGFGIGGESMHLWGKLGLE